MSEDTLDFAIAEHLGESAHPGGFDAALSQIIAANKAMLPKLDRAGQRAQHPKAHATLKATFTTREVPVSCRVGLFATAGAQHDCLIRFSNSNQLIDNPKGGDAHGMAIKVMDVEGKKFQPDPSGAKSHDFILLNNETFFDGDLKRYLKLNVVAGDYLSLVRNGRPVLRGLVSGLKAVTYTKFTDPKLGQAITQTSDQFPVSPLLETFFSTTPYLLGPDIAVKYKVTPKLPDGTATVQSRPGRDENFLNKQMRSALLDRDHGFVLSAQIKTSRDPYPIETPDVPWAGAAEIPLADIHISRFKSLSDAEWQVMRFGHEAQSYNIWNVTADHRPLGVLNRLRRGVYRELHRCRTHQDGDVYK